MDENCRIFYKSIENAGYSVRNLMLVSAKCKIWKSDESWIVRIVRIMRAEMELLCTLSIP